LLEALYDLEQPRERWFKRVLEARANGLGVRTRSELIAQLRSLQRTAADAAPATTPAPQR
jgi:hypothetical protein